MAAAGLQGAHAADLIPTGAEQRRHFPPLCDGLGGVAAVSQGVLVARLCAVLSAHPASLAAAHSWLLTQCPAPGPGMAVN